MKYTVEGFSQEKLIEYKLNTDHAIILRWFIDFRSTKKMASIIIDNEQYYWVKYSALIETLPILGLKKDTIYRKFRDLVDCKVLKHYTTRNGGVFSHYNIDENYDKLIYNAQSYGSPSGTSDINPNATDTNPEGKRSRKHIFLI